MLAKTWVVRVVPKNQARKVVIAQNCCTIQWLRRVEQAGVGDAVSCGSRWLRVGSHSVRFVGVVSARRIRGECRAPFRLDEGYERAAAET